MNNDDNGVPERNEPEDVTADTGDNEATPWELSGSDEAVDGTAQPGSSDDADVMMDGSGPGNDDSGDPGARGDADAPGRPRLPAFGEIVSKRHPILIALVMIFALFLAVAPLFFRYERNALHDAVAVYTRVCDARGTGRLTDDWLKSVTGPALNGRSAAERAAFVDGMECVDPKTRSFALRLVEGRALGPNRAYVLSVFAGADIRKVEKAGGHVANFYFPVINDTLVIDEMPKDGR